MMHHGGQKKIQFDNLKCLVMLGPQEVSLFKPIEGLSVPVVSCFKGHLKPCCKKNSTAKKMSGRLRRLHSDHPTTIEIRNQK